MKIEEYVATERAGLAEERINLIRSIQADRQKALEERDRWKAAAYTLSDEFARADNRAISAVQEHDATRRLLGAKAKTLEAMVVEARRWACRLLWERDEARAERDREREVDIVEAYWNLPWEARHA